MTTVTLLAENLARGEGILGEHGLSFWVDTGTHKVLFDTGQGLALEHNARRLGIDLTQADAIVLSHGHFDHVGGLEAVWPKATKARLFLHPRATEPKWSGNGPGGSARHISREYVETSAFRLPGREVVFTAEPVEVVPGVFTTGAVPRETGYEDTGGPFFLDKNLMRPDPLEDEVALWIPGADGVTLLSGCAHAGIVNTLRRVEKLSGGKPVKLLVGGLHLEAASPERLARTFDELRARPALRLAFCHCTGPSAGRALWREFPDRCLHAHAGAVFALSA